MFTDRTAWQSAAGASVAINFNTYANEDFSTPAGLTDSGVTFIGVQEEYYFFCGRLGCDMFPSGILTYDLHTRPADDGTNGFLLGPVSDSDTSAQIEILFPAGTTAFGADMSRLIADLPDRIFLSVRQGTNLLSISKDLGDGFVGIVSETPLAEVWVGATRRSMDQALILDNVLVSTPVPEPATLLMTVFGFFLLSEVKKRKAPPA